MSVGALIFSRFSSKRLPGKALIDIEGRCLLGRVIDRTKLIKGVDRIIVATSTENDDDQIAKFCDSNGVDLFRGSLENPSKRALDACDHFKLLKFARICGDRPFFDPELNSQLISLANGNNYDLVTTTNQKPLPPGLTAELISVASLRNNISRFSPENKEHLTSFFYENENLFNIKRIKPPSYIRSDSSIRLVVDDNIDLRRAQSIAAHIKSKVSSNDFMPEIVTLAIRWDNENIKSIV